VRFPLFILLLPCLLSAQPSDSALRSIQLNPFYFNANTPENKELSSLVFVSTARIKAMQQASLKEVLPLINGVFVQEACQSCGFSRIQTDGLTGPYSGLLLNGRPFLPSMGLVYGLEFVPAELLSALQLDRSGTQSPEWSSFYPAGLLDIQTSPAAQQTGWLNLRQSHWEGGSGDRQLTLFQPLFWSNGSASFWVNRRDRSAWDVHPDGFSESPKLELSTLGISLQYALNRTHKLEFNFRGLLDSRTGGSDMELPLPERRVAESIAHRYGSAEVAWSFSPNPRYAQTTFLQFHTLHRDSYYGGNGMDLPGPDSTGQAMLYFGKSQQTWLLTGWKAQITLHPSLKASLNASLGHELLNDSTPGLQRSLIQQSLNGNLGLQLSWIPKPLLRFKAGLQCPINTFSGSIVLENFTSTQTAFFLGVLPNLGAEFLLSEALQLGLNYRLTQRSPQVFEEDLHLSMLGAKPIFSVWSPNLSPERGHQGIVWVRYQGKLGKSTEWEAKLNATLHRLHGVFVWNGLSTQPDFFLQEKSNGKGLWMFSCGFESELRGKQWLLQGMVNSVVQRLDVAQELWDSEEWNLSGFHPRLLKVPAWSGMLRAEIFPGQQQKWSLSTFVRYWGSLELLRMPNQVIDLPAVVQSPSFFEISFTARYLMGLGQKMALEWEGGVHNLSNAVQNDYGMGAGRDPNYVYGPGLPRRFSLGLRFRWF
jgi:outer membrane receptor for ferrienterochelin and colicins